MGDAEEVLERDLIKSGLIEDVDVLKIGHHGSKASTGIELLNTALPEVAVIQVGKNSYGHPTASVLDKLKKLGSSILRTDELGDITWRFRVE